jgi:RNA polymerase sigma factor (sigma-70 family)
MAGATGGLPLRQLETLLSEGILAGQSDAQLLERFATHRDALAFEVLMQRHGPMVLAVCRGVLTDPNDAQDAFQTTFLVLVRKARSIWVVGASLGSWLHRVAYRIAIQANARAARRRLIERRAGEMVRPDTAPEPLGPELLPALHEEIGRLPEKYRAPIVLCHLERMTHEQAARQLGWSPGAVRGRVARGREVLRKRLTRRGMALSGGLLITVLSEQAAPAAVPPFWIAATARAAIALWAGQASALALAAALAGGTLPALLGARAITGASLLAAIVLDSVAGVAGIYWLDPADDRDARALALAVRLEPVARRSLSLPAPRPPGLQNFDRFPPPDEGYQWVAFDDDLGSDRILRNSTWGGVIVRQPSIAGQYLLHQGKNGDLIVTLGHSLEREAEPFLNCRPVVFDERRRSYRPVFEGTVRCTSEVGDRTAIDRFRLSRTVLPLVEFHAIGVEQMTPELREDAAQEPRKVAALDALASPPQPAASGIAPSSGCSWVIGPFPLDAGNWAASASGSHAGAVCALSKTSTGVLTIDVAYQSRTLVHNIGGCVEEYRPVLIDTSGQRHVLTGTQSYFDSSSGPDPRAIYGRADTAVFRLELGPPMERNVCRFPISPSDIAVVGIERLSPETLRDARISAFMKHVRAYEPSYADLERRWRAQPDHRVHRSVPKPSYPYVPEAVAWLGAYEFLQSHVGQFGTTPAPLQSARIADFASHMRREEYLRGSQFTSWVDPTLVYAYELLQHQGSKARADP